MGGDDDGHEEGGQQAQRQVGQRAHPGGILHPETSGRDNDEQNIGKSEIRMGSGVEFKVRDEARTRFRPRASSLRQKNQPANNGSGQGDSVTLEGAALDAMQRGHGVVQGDLRLNFSDPGGIEIVLGLKHAVGGR